MKRIEELLAAAALALFLISCTTLGAAPGAGSEAGPSLTSQGNQVTVTVLEDSAPGEEATNPDPTATLEGPTQIDLEAVLSIPATLPDGDSLNLEFTLINHSETGWYVLKWFTPLEGLGGEIFRVERDGQHLPYEGPLAARGDPTPDAYVYLDAGASVSATVDLAAAYDFSKPGEYTIAFISPRISHAARTEGEMAASVDDLGPVAIPSNQVSVMIAADSASGEAEVVEGLLDKSGAMW